MATTVEWISERNFVLVTCYTSPSHTWSVLRDFLKLYMPEHYHNRIWSISSNKTFLDIYCVNTSSEEVPNVKQKMCARCMFVFLMFYVLSYFSFSCRVHYLKFFGTCASVKHRLAKLVVFAKDDACKLDI